MSDTLHILAAVAEHEREMKRPRWQEADVVGFAGASNPAPARLDAYRPTSQTMH
jgi:hypothetical protein